MKRAANDNNFFSPFKILVYLGCVAFLVAVWGGAAWIASKALGDPSRVPGDGWRGYMTICINVPGEPICHHGELGVPYTSEAECKFKADLWAAIVKSDMDKEFPGLKSYTRTRCVHERET